MDNAILDNLNVEEILESPEEPILTLDFKCSSDDYRDSEEMWSGLVNISSTSRIRLDSFLMILACVFVALCYSPYGFYYSKYYYVVGAAVIFSIMTVIFNIYIIYCCKRKYSYFMHILTGRSIKSATLVYENRTKREIKKIIIPCKYRFYKTYFIKTSPSFEIMCETSAEKIVNVPLTSDIPIEYSSIKYIAENKKSIILFQRIFFPKDQLNENEKQKLDLILNKICAQNNVIR